MHYVYVLYSSKLNKRYIGKTSDIDKRLIEHNSGTVKWTSTGTPWILIYFEGYLSNKDISRRELFLKSGRGRELLDNIALNSLLEAKSIGSVRV